MKNIEKIFERCLASSGRNLKIYIPNEETDDSLILKDLRTIVNYFVGENGLNINIDVTVMFIDNPYINACVTKEESIYFIGLYRGVISELRSFVNYFIIENLPEDMGSIEPVDNLIGFEFFKEGDCEKYILANHFANNILFLILYHELGHICYGHCDNNSFNNSYFEANKIGIGSIEHQAREFMADFFALINSMAFYGDQYYKSKEAFMLGNIYYSISLYSLYVYFENRQIDTDYNSLIKRTHPYPAIRLLYMLDVMEEEIKFELEELYQVDWSSDSNLEETVRHIITTSNMAVLDFSSNLDEGFRLSDRMYQENYIKIRQEIQNKARNIYEKHYRKYSLVKLKEIGEVNDKYVYDLILAGNKSVSDLLKNLFATDGKYELALMSAFLSADDKYMDALMSAILSADSKTVMELLSKYQINSEK